jgi:tetratricopeptide (TPR) repeat protein
MNRIFLTGLMCLFLGTGLAFATVFDDANRKYQSGDFAGAAAAYETVITREGPRAAVFYNLGNSYQNLKRYGMAILAYERARLLTPRDPDLLANLVLARKAAAAFEETGINPKLEAVLGYLSKDEWAWLVASSALILGGAVLLSGWARLPKRMYLLTTVFCGAAGVLIVGGSAVLYMRRGESVRGIVVAENATIRLSPFEKAESLGTPGPGKMVYLGVKSGDFRYVELPGANLHGWLADKDVAAIVLE